MIMIVHLTHTILPEPKMVQRELHRYAIDIQYSDTTEDYSWTSLDYTYEVSLPQLRADIESYYNTQVQQRILSGFMFNDTPIWLSAENQQNYITAYTLGLDYLKVKGGTDSEPKYLELTSKEEIAEFVKAMQVYIQECIAWGWEKKDSVDYSVYGFNEHSNKTKNI